MPVYRNLVIQIAHGILLRSFCDQQQWSMDEEMKPEQEDEGQQENNSKRNINRNHQRAASFVDQRDRAVNDQISLCIKSLCDRSHYSNHIFLKIIMVGSDHVLVAPDFGRIKIIDGLWRSSILQVGRGDHCTIFFNKPQRRIKIRLHSR